MVDVIKTLNIKYLPANPASSFRAIHESLIDYGSQQGSGVPHLHARGIRVGMAHGYFKATGKPLMTLCHGTVGLQHAAMAIYNAWCERVPVIVVRPATILDAAKRPPGVPTFHSAQDINALVRDFTKWDDTRFRCSTFAQSFVRMYKISDDAAVRSGHGWSLDAGLQQEPIHDDGERPVHSALRARRRRHKVRPAPFRRRRATPRHGRAPGHCG